MPPRDMQSRVCRTACRAGGSPLRLHARKRTRRSIVCRNLGARPKPPWTGSKLRSSRAAACGIRSGAGSPASPWTSPTDCRCWVMSAAAASMSPRLLRQASASDSRMRRKPGRPPAVVGREVGAARERPQVGREEDRHGPAAVAADHLDGGHVDLVEIGALLTVHLDAHEMLVEDGGDALILERLVFHDVAPVAGAVADGEEERAVELAGAGDGLLAPGIPIDGVVGVLAQVGAALLREAVGEARLCHRIGSRCWASAPF